MNFYLMLPTGPRVALLQLSVSELPDHRRPQVPSTVDPECSSSARTENDQTSKLPAKGGSSGIRAQQFVPPPSKPTTANEPQSDSSISEEPLGDLKGKQQSRSADLKPSHTYRKQASLSSSAPSAASPHSALLLLAPFCVSWRIS